MNQSYTTNASQPRYATLLFINGCFLLVAGGSALVSELCAYFVDIGPEAAAFHLSPYAIGFVEAHGLAILTGLLLVRASRGSQKRFWHLHAILVHLLLGGANLLFWQSFVQFGYLPVGIITTILHSLFLVTQMLAFFSRR